MRVLELSMPLGPLRERESRKKGKGDSLNIKTTNKINKLHACQRLLLVYYSKAMRKILKTRAIVCTHMKKKNEKNMIDG